MTNTERLELSSALTKIDTTKPKETIPFFVKEIERQLPGSKVIYISETGSTLHGTNSNNSDSDYKGIYIPSIESVILDEYHPVINIKTNQEDTKNGADDIDMELYSIFKFIEKASAMESNNIEILFSMFSDKIMYETEEVELIKKSKDDFLSYNVEGFIGFAMSMAYKYSEKGDRLREVDALVSFFKDYMEGMSKAAIKRTPISEMKGLAEFVDTLEYVDIVELEASDKKMALYLKVLSSKFILSHKIEYVYKGILSKGSAFGKRAKKAKDSDGIDRKAFAHALRAILQSKELLTTGHIVFPLTYAERLKELKFSKTMTKKEYSDIIEEEYESLIELKNSDKIILPAVANFDKLKELKIALYRMNILKG